MPSADARPPHSSLLLIVAVAAISSASSPFSVVLLPPAVAYKRYPCTPTVRSQFQFPDCYVPPADVSVPLSSASFLLSHDSATGYLPTSSATPSGQVASRYGKNQVGTAYDQLNDGARALDLRPKLLSNGTVIFQHGYVDVPVTLDALVSDAVSWCAENDDELVLLLPSNFAYESTADDDGGGYDDDDDGGGRDMVAAMSSVYERYGVPYLHCNDVYGFTVGDAMEMSALPTGGHMLALDGKDYYGSFCGKSNWAQDRLVTCYSNVYVPCTRRNSKAWDALRRYVAESANNDPTDDAGKLGPSANLYDRPFSEIQALWQVDATSATLGVAHLSSILDDNRKSKINREMMGMIHDGEFDSVSLFAVDNVALDGNAIFSVLRNACGQSTLDVCGRDVAKPRASHVPVSRILLLAAVCLYLGAVGWMASMVWAGRYADPRRTYDRRKTVLTNFCTFLGRVVRRMCGEVGDAVGAGCGEPRSTESEAAADAPPYKSPSVAVTD